MNYLRKLLYFIPFISSHLYAINSLPDEFFVTQHWLSTTVTFDITTKNQKLGIVDRKFWSLLPQYIFFNSENKLQAKATMRWLAVTAVFDIYDTNNTLLGTVDEHFFSILPNFDIIAPNGQLQATASMNFWGTAYSICDPITKTEMATFTRPFFRLKDNWVVNITNRDLFNTKNIDPRLFITLMAFQTDSDNWKKKPHLCNAKVQSNALPKDADILTIIHLVEWKLYPGALPHEYRSCLNELIYDQGLTDGQKQAIFYLLDHTQK